MAHTNTVVGKGYFGKAHKRYYNGSLAAIAIVPYNKAKEKDLSREYRVYEKLNHKNVVKLLGPPELKSDGWYIPIAFIDGSTLSELIFNGHGMLSEVEKDIIILGMCEGLSYLHENNVVHQDLKPDNIMVEYSTKQAIIIDKGLGKCINYSNSGSPFSSSRDNGCFQYTAPEVRVGMTRSKTADVWSMGKVIAEVLLECMLRMNNCLPENINQLLRGLKYAYIVYQMLQKYPEWRVSMTKVLEHLKSFRVPGQANDWITAIPIVLGSITVCALAILAIL